MAGRRQYALICVRPSSTLTLGHIGIPSLRLEAALQPVSAVGSILVVSEHGLPTGVVVAFLDDQGITRELLVP